MDKLTLYHGSSKVIQKPVYGSGKTYDDFGPGFYCTENLELAKEWACTKDIDGYVNQYELDPAGLKILNLAGDDNTLLNWIALLAANRKIPITTPVMKKAFERLQARYLPLLSDYDVIVGYRADDVYFSYARAYIDDEISLAELGQLMQEAEVQYVLKSPKAFKAIQFRSVVSVDAAEYSIKRILRSKAEDGTEYSNKKKLKIEADSSVEECSKKRFRNETDDLMEFRRILGEAMDYAANSCRLTLDEFMELFITSGLAEQFAAGVPKYVPGMTGAELACVVMERAGLQREFPAPRISFTLSREYWCGWMLAYYQRMTGISYKRIYQYTPMKEIEKLYNSLHKSSDEKFLNILNQHMVKCASATRLQMLRKAAGFSQKGLAEKSGVNLRNIQQYEQRAKDINKGAAGSLAAIAKVLGCRIEDLLEDTIE